MFGTIGYLTTHLTGKEKAKYCVITSRTCWKVEAADLRRKDLKLLNEGDIHCQWVNEPSVSVHKPSGGHFWHNKKS